MGDSRPTDTDATRVPGDRREAVAVEPSQALAAFPAEDLVFQVADDLARNPAAVYLAKLAPSGRRAMAGSLDRIAHALAGRRLEKEEVLERVDRGLWEAVPWQDLRYAHTQALRAWISTEWSPATANRMLAALKGVLREAWRLELMTADEYHRAADLARIPAKTLPRGRALSDGELRQLAVVCRDDPNPALGARDSALLALLYVGGLRRSEVKGLDLAHWDPDHAQVLVLGAKGRKDRKVFLEEGGARALGRWIEVRGDDPGPLMCPVTRGGRVRVRRLSDQAVIAVTQRRGKEAGLRPFTPHDLRRSCASDLIDAGEDMVTVRDHLGHASVQTTERYDRRGDERLKRAVGKLHWSA